MNSEQIFNLALGLQPPWIIKEISFNVVDNRRVLDIEIGYISGNFVDETGRSTVYDHKDRRWRHLNFFEHECYIKCSVPRIKVEDCIKTVEVPWARQGSGFTLMFEAFSMLLIEQEMPINKVGKVLGEYPNRVRTIFDYWIGLAYSDADHSKITKLGIDETSSKKGHNYVTVAVDMETHRVVFATEGKGAETISEIAEYLDEQGSPREEISSVCIDLSPSFISGVAKEFDKAAIVFDRFHVKQMANKAMDEVRKQDNRMYKEELRHCKYLFLKGHDKLNKEQRQKRDGVLELLPNIGQAYFLKELLDTFWTLRDPEVAQGFLSYWIDLARESKINPMVKLASSINAHWTGIINYTEHKMSNGILESINSKIQLAKRRARGYRNINNFINMIYFIAGKLKFNYPHYST
jgi:transposase